jgi:hypothetical protein
LKRFIALWVLLFYSAVACPFAGEPWFLTQPLDRFSAMDAVQAEAFVQSFSGQPVQNIDDAVYSIHLRFGAQSEALVMDSFAIPALESVLNALSISEIYERVPRPIFLALIGMLSHSVPLECFEAGRHHSQYSRLMRVIGRTQENLVERVAACSDVNELALLLRLQFHRHFETKKSVMTEVSPNGPVSRIGAMQLLHDFAPAQIFTLVYLMPIEQVEEIVSVLLKTNDPLIFVSYPDELAALVKAAILKADRILDHPGIHLGSPVIRNRTNSHFSPLEFGVYFSIAFVSLESLLDENLVPRMALSAAFGGLLQSLTRRFWFHRLRQRRLESAAKTQSDSLILGRDFIQCSKGLLGRIFPRF